jgi:hypothetical protein
MCRDVSLLKLFELQIFAENIHNISTYGNKTKFSPILIHIMKSILFRLIIGTLGDSSELNS